MQIFIKTLIGKFITLNVDKNNTIEEIKKMIEKKEGVNVKKQILIYSGVFLDNDNTLSDYGICDGVTIGLSIKF